MQRIIGLDIGSWSIKAMVMESSLRRVSFVELREHHLPVDAHGAPLPEVLAGAVRAVLARLDVDVLTVGVPGVQVLMRELTLPFADEKRVTPVLGFQLESLLPRSLDTMVYDWHVIAKDAEGAHILCPAADKQWFEQWLGELRAGGAQPRHVTLATLAMDNLVPHLDLSELADQGAPVAIVDLGHRSTQVTLLRNGKVEAVRALARGGHQVTQALARALGLAYADAEHLKHHELDLGGRAPEGVSPAEHARTLKVAAQALEPILRELKMTVAAMSERPRAGAHEATALGGVILCGGMARLPGIDALIEQLLGAPVIPLRLKGPLWEALGETGDDVRRVGVAAAALALEHVRDSDPHRVNLRHGDLMTASDFGAIRARAGWIAAFLAVLLVIFFVRKAIRISTLEDQEQQLATRLDEFEKTVLGEEPDHTMETKARFELVLDTVTSPPGSETDEVYPAMTAFKIFYEVTRIQRALNDEAERNALAEAGGGEDEDEFEEDELGLPKPPDADGASEAKAPPEKRQVELNTFAADLKAANNGQATLTGSAFDIVTVESFASKLRDYPCFKKVERQDTRKTTNPNHPNWTDFQLKIEVKCDLAASAPRAEAPRGGGNGAAAADRTEEE